MEFWCISKYSDRRTKERKRKNDLKKTEEQITCLEQRNQIIDQLMTQEDVYSNSIRCQELAEEKHKNDCTLEELYEQWETLAEGGSLN